MKLPKDFRISTKILSCREGGTDHSYAQTTDEHGIHNGYKCRYCGAKLPIKKRKRKIVSKITL